MEELSTRVPRSIFFPDMGNSGEERAYITNDQKGNSQVTEGYLWYSSARLMSTKQELVGGL